MHSLCALSQQVFILKCNNVNFIINNKIIIQIMNIINIIKYIYYIYGHHYYYYYYDKIMIKNCFKISFVVVFFLVCCCLVVVFIFFLGICKRQREPSY